MDEPGTTPRSGRLASLFESDVPRADLPRYLAPLPAALENLALNLAWLVVAINLAGTAFGFYYYAFQFAETPVVMWPFVPDSPMATLFIALAIAAWKLDHARDWLTALAFFGNVILGGWTVYVHLAFWPAFDYLWAPMRLFLITSHAAMVLQAFALHRIGEFSVRAVGVASLWYGANVVVDYFAPVIGSLHHTWLPVNRYGPAFLGATNLGVAAAGAFVLFTLALYLSMATRLHRRAAENPGATGAAPDRL